MSANEAWPRERGRSIALAMRHTVSFVVEPLLAQAKAWIEDGCPVQVVPCPEDDRLVFFAQHYELSARYVLDPGFKEQLDGSNPGYCRFCDTVKAKSKFNKVAHALARSLGNESLTSSYECNDCNKEFGEGIENELGNWTLPARWLAQIEGYGGLPKLRWSKTGGWRFEFEDGKPQVKQWDGFEIFKVHEGDRKVDLKLRRLPYYPIDVYKAFVKMALTILPEKEIPNFKDALEWIRCKDRSWVLMKPLHLRSVFVPGPRPFDDIALFLFIRKDNTDNVPYAIFVIAFGNEQFQLVVPCPAKDAGRTIDPSAVLTWPTPFERGRALARKPLQERICDLSGIDRVADDYVSVTSTFDKGTHTDAEGNVREF